MSDDYLWDRTGPPDAQVEHLEGLLSRYRASDGEAPSRAAWGTLLAMAAVAVLATGIAWMGPSPLTPGHRSSGWALSTLEGQPTVDSRRLEGQEDVPVGRWIETDARSSARLDIADAGRVVIAPNSRLRIISTALGDHRMHLDHGSLDAVIWAPPGEVVVSTPAVTAVDLGCAYSLTLARDGIGTLRVTTGWVGLVHDGREAFVPAGAAVAILGQRGPGTPVLVSATAALSEAVEAFDRTHDGDARRVALDTILFEASPGDALTLWHLLTRVVPADRGRVFDALAARLAPPAQVTRDGIEAGDRGMLDAWWDTLGYGSRDWWRLWLREWRHVR